MKNIDKINYMYEDAYAAKSFYRGTSFRINDWEPDTYYFHDDQYIDWVIINGAICICMRSHISNEDNKPQLLYQNNIPVGISPNSCWSFVFGGVSSNNGSDNNQPTVVNKDLTRLRFQNNILEISNDEGNTWNYVADFSNINQTLDLSAEVVQVNNSDTTSSASVDLVDNTLKFSFTLQRGADGAPGNNGDPGADGTDGNGFDHIFYLTETPVLDSAHDPSKLAAVQDDNYYAEDIGWSTYAMQVNETNEYQWMSTRKKVNGVWGTFSEPIILNTYASEGIVPEVSYTSFVFCRTNASFTDSDSVPTGGSYKNPFPSYSGTIGGKNVDWSDSVPQGTEMIWMSSVTFDNKTDYDTTTVEWSKPRRMSDTNEFQVEFTQEVPYKTPEPLQRYYDADPINYEENWRKNNSTWYDGFTDVNNDGEDDRPLSFSPVYMATASMHNGVWTDWTVVKIKGEDGNDGLPINVIGSVPTYNDLPQCSEYKGNPGDAFVVEEYTNSENVLEYNVLFVFSGDNKQCWIYLGPLSATGAYVHIKYADRLWPIDSDKKGADDYWIGFTRANDEIPGETPGDYIGIYSDNNENGSMNPDDYKWSKWVGQDGWGYEYIYKGTNNNSAPDVPLSEGIVNGKYPQDNDYVPSDWSDDPVNISETMKYCWMCYRVKQNNTWSDFKGSNESGGKKAALWAKWGEQGEPGEDGAGVEYIFALSEIETTDFSKSNLYSPKNEWEYDKPEHPWYDNPQQVSAQYPVQWVSERVKPQGATKWGDWTPPTVWSSFGTLGMTSTIVKVWQRSQEQLTLNNIKKPQNGATYSLQTNELKFSDGLTHQNGWYYNEDVAGDGRYLYSLGAHVVTNKDSITINRDDWKLLTLESVNGADGSGQSAISMTADPDSVLINVDNDGNSIWDHTIYGSANYYYGTSLIKSDFSHEAGDGISVVPTDSSDEEHNFKITVSKGTPFTSSKQIKITLAPNPNTIDAGENGIVNLSELTKSIFLNPIKSNDVWSIWVNTDQIIDQSNNHQQWSETIEAKIMLNNKPYSGDNAQLYYILGSESQQPWDKNQNNTYSYTINQENIGDVANAFTIILKVNDVNLIHQVVSIIKNGTDGTGITGLYEYYTWNNKTEWDVTYSDEQVDVFETGKTLNIDDVLWTCNKIPTTDGQNPCLWNFEVIKTTDGEFNIIQPALISSNGKGIKDISEYYLITANASAPTPTVDELKSAWTRSYDYSKCDENNQYILNCECIEYTDGTTHITTPEVVFAYSKGEDGQSILDIFEYYLYAPKGYQPSPDWGNYNISWNSGEAAPSILYESGLNRIWSLENIPTEMPNGCPVLWNVEVVVYADSGDDYTHTRPIPITDRGLEIKRIDEYYLVSKEVSGITFSADTIDQWTYVAPNESVPVTNINTPYLWNAELITYVDDSVEYRPASRIGVFIKGDKGDPGENANNLALDFSDDMNTIRIDRDTKLSIEDEAYTNEITLHQGSNDIKSWTATIEQWPSMFGSKPSLDVDNLGKAILEFTVPAGTNVENKQAIIIQGSTYIEAEKKTLTTRKTYNIMPIFEPTRYNIISDISRQSCDYKGLINGNNYFNVNLSISGVASGIPAGYTLWLQDSRDETLIPLTELTLTLYTINGDTNIYWYKVYLCYGDSFSAQTIRDFTTIEIGWQQKPEVYFTLNTSELYGNIASTGALSLATTKVDYTFREDGKDIKLNSDGYTVSLDPNNDDYQFDVTVSDKTFGIDMTKSPNVSTTEDFTLPCVIKVVKNGEYIADVPIWIMFESHRYYAVIDDDDITVNPRFMPKDGSIVYKDSLHYYIYENNTKIASYCRVSIDDNNDGNILKYFGILSADFDSLTIKYDTTDSVVNFLNNQNGVCEINVTVTGYKNKSDYLNNKNPIAKVATKLHVRLESSEKLYFYYLYNYEPLQKGINEILFHVGSQITIIPSEQLNGDPYTLKCSIDGGSIEKANISTDSSTGNLKFDCTNVNNTLEFYLYNRGNELVGYSKLFRNGYYTQLEGSNEGKEELRQASTTTQQIDWLNQIPEVINNETTVTIPLNELPSGYNYVLEKNNTDDISIEDNILQINSSCIESTPTIQVKYGSSMVIASKTFKVEKSWYIECPDELNVYTVKINENEVGMVTPYYYAFPLNTNGVYISFPDEVTFNTNPYSIIFDSTFTNDVLDIFYENTNKVIKSVKLNKYDITESTNTHTGSYYNSRACDVYISTNNSKPGKDAKLVPAKTFINLDSKTYYIYLPEDATGQSHSIGTITYADTTQPTFSITDFTTLCGNFVSNNDKRILKIDFNRSYTTLNAVIKKNTAITYELCLPVLVNGTLKNNLYEFTKDDMICLIGKELWLDITVEKSLTGSCVVNYSVCNSGGTMECRQLNESSILHIKYVPKYNTYDSIRKLDICPEQI